MMTAQVRKVTAELRGSIISLHEQDFHKGEDGSLVHCTDGELRAMVPPEGWDDYLEYWPDAAPVVAYLRNSPEPSAVPEVKVQTKSQDSTVEVQSTTDKIINGAIAQLQALALALKGAE